MLRHFWMILLGGLFWLVPDDCAAGKLKVLTTFLPVHSFTLNVAGDLAQVENLLPPGVGPHDYQFSPRNMRQLSEAGLLIQNGVGLEKWLERTVRSAGIKVAIISAAAGLEKELITESPALHLEGTQAPAAHSHVGDPNPHFWLDPRLACHAVTNILRGLQTADPANANGYATNAARYVERLRRLDEEIAQALAPVRGRAIVTYHDAFPYFARRYGLNIVGVIEQVPDVDPSPRYLSQLGKVIARERVTFIFTEPQFSDRLARRLAEDLKVGIASLDTLEAGTLAATSYEDGMRANLRVLQRSLK